MIKILYMLLIAISALGAQAGKMEETGFRLYGGIYSGSITSDFENRYRIQSLLGNSAESAWDKSIAPGLNLGGQFFLKSPQDHLTGWMFRYELESVASDYSSNSFGAGFYSGNTYSLSQGRSDLSVGAVLNISELIRFTPRFGIRSLSQTLDGGSVSVIAPGFIGLGGTSISTGNSGGYIGALFEYDYKPGITFYMDSLLVSPFLLNSPGTYSYSDTAIILASNGSIVGLNSYSGDYSASYSKFSLGTSVEIAPKSRIFAQLENESIDSKIKTDSGVRFLAVTVNNESAAALSFTGAYLTSALSNAGKQTMLLNGFRMGFSYDF